MLWVPLIHVTELAQNDYQTNYDLSPLSSFKNVIAYL